MPITPSKVTVKINNQNKTMTLINGEEINILKAAGLSDVSFELVLPQVSYPFSNGGAQSAAYYLSLFERLKVSKTPFQFILNRQKPGGGMFHYTNLTVGLETYEITDDAGEGFDVKVKINDEEVDFKQLPANGQIANDKNLVVSDSKDAMSSEVDAMLRQSKAILESVDYHERVVKSCEGMLLQLNPQIAKEKEQTEKINKLEGKVSGIEGKIDKMMGWLQQTMSK